MNRLQRAYRHLIYQFGRGASGTSGSNCREAISLTALRMYEPERLLASLIAAVMDQFAAKGRPGSTTGPRRAVQSRLQFDTDGNRTPDPPIKGGTLPTKINLYSPYTLTPKRTAAGQLYSEGAQGTPSGTRRALGKLISVFSHNVGTVGALFPILAPPRNRAKVGRAGLT